MFAVAQVCGYRFYALDVVLPDFEKPDQHLSGLGGFRDGVCFGFVRYAIARCLLGETQRRVKVVSVC